MTNAATKTIVLMVSVMLSWTAMATAALDGPGEREATQASQTRIVILKGPGAEAWQNKLGAERVHLIGSLDDCPAGAVLILPDQFLNARELGTLTQLMETGKLSRVLALGKSAFTDGGPSAVEPLHVGKSYYYVPILYPEKTEPGKGKYEQFRRTAQFCASEGAHGFAIFSYLYTSPGYWGEQGADTIRDCFDAYGKWKAFQRPTPVGVPATPKVLFLHTGDTWRIDPQGAADWAIRLGANTLQLTVSRFYFGRGMALYPSRFKQETVIVRKGKDKGKRVKAENPTPTYLPDLIEACKERNLGVWANIFWGETSAPLPESQRQVMQDGSRGVRPCPLSGAEHIDKLCETVEEVLAMYPYISCLGLDEFHIRCRSWRTWGCFCPACKKRFKKEYGYELKPETVIKGWGKPGRQRLTEDFYKFRIDVLNEMVFEKFRRAINRVRPGLVMLEWAPRNYRVWAIQPQTAIMYGLDGYGPEYWHGPGTKGGYLSYPQKFEPRSEPVVAFRMDGREYPVRGEVVRVDCFQDADVLAWARSQDKAQWPLLVSANDERVMYCSLDPLGEGVDSEPLLKQLLDWVNP